MANSTAQTIPLVEVYDYVLSSGDPSSGTTSKGKQGLRVKATLQYDKALTIAPDAVVWAAGDTTYATLTDGNGFWHLFLTPNNKISPANTYYTIEIEGGISYQIQVTDVAVPGPGWQSSAPGILLNIPSALAPTTSTVGAITATGLITGQAGLSITGGGATIVGGLTVSGGEIETGGLTVDSLTFSTAAGQVHPGATSLSFRNNANSADNLIVTDAGNATVRGSLTVTAGPLTVSAGGAAITGDSTITGALTVTSTINGQTISAAANFTGTVAIASTLTSGSQTITGNLTINAGALDAILMTATGQDSWRIGPGTGGGAGLGFYDATTPAQVLLLGATGLATFRNALRVPPSVGGALPTTSYGTVPVKIDDQLLGAGAASITFVNPLPTGFRHLLIEIYARGDTAATNVRVVIKFNNDSAANYDTQEYYASAATNNPSESLGVANPQPALIPANTATANYFGVASIRIPHYQSTVGNKVAISEWGMASANTTGTGFRGMTMTKWRTAGTAITRIDLSPLAGNFVAGSLFTLWGIP